MIPSQYRITISGKTGSAAQGADGFIDPTTIEQYMAAGSVPASYEKSQEKKRGNVRFRFVREQLQLEANIYVDATVAAAADANTPATSLVLTILVERGDPVLFTRDELNDGAELRGVDALKRMVARALTENRTITADIYDPTMTTDDGTGSGIAKAPAARRGVRVEALVVGPLYSNLTAAAASVTVAAL